EGLVEVQDQALELRVGETLAPLPDPGVDVIGVDGPQQNPEVAFDLDVAGAQTDGAQEVEIGGDLLGHEQAVSAGEGADALPGAGEIGDTLFELPIDLVDRTGKFRRSSDAQLFDSRQRYTGGRQGLDLDQVYGVLRGVAAVARCVAVWLVEQSTLVIVADRAHRHAGVSG